MGRNFIEGVRHIRGDVSLLLLIVLVFIPSLFIHSTQKLLSVLAVDVLPHFQFKPPPESPDTVSPVEVGAEKWHPEQSSPVQFSVAARAMTPFVLAVGRIIVNRAHTFGNRCIHLEHLTC